MSDFLTFLNSADINDLTKIPGVTRPTAGNIIAARPFDFVEDCAKVRGVGKNLLGRMQSFFEEEINESRNSAMIPVEEEAMPALIEERQPAQESTQDRPSFFSGLGQAFINIVRAFARLMATLLVIVGIGAGIYYGLPYINKKFIAPVEQNTARVKELESEIANLQTQLDKIENLQTQLNETNSRMDLIEKSVEAHTASLDKLDLMQTELETRLIEKNDKTLLELKHEVAMTRALDMLGRARLYLAQSNFGLAREDVQSAHDLLVKLQTEKDDKLLEQIIARLDLTLDNLPAFPVIASGDLEIAWQMLITGAPVNITTATSTPAPLTTLTPTPAAISTFTPTPFGLPTATSTP